MGFSIAFANKMEVRSAIQLGTTTENTALLREATTSIQDDWQRQDVSVRKTQPTNTGPSLLLVTDSYGTVPSNVHGDFGSHLSQMSGLPIHRVSEGGAGPHTPTILARDSGALLENRPAVIWLFVARYLPDRHGWKTPNWPPR